MKQVSFGNIAVWDSDIIHDSTKEMFRSPLGAVTEGTEIALALKTDIPDIDRAVLCVLRGGSVDRLEMSPGDGLYRARYVTPLSGGWDGARTESLPPVYERLLLHKPEGDRRLLAPTPEPEGGGSYGSPAGGEVLWYWFEVVLHDGAVCHYGAEPPYMSGLGRIYPNPPPAFQITVYDSAFTTPDWAKTAVMYQIFPDRFCMGDAEKVRAGIEYHRDKGRAEIELHESWEEQPVYEAKPGQKYYMPSDIFGGDLEGIRQRLPYLKELGVTLIYLNPIFEASSNHRYNTGDYLKIDPILGDGTAFRRLVKEAKDSGMRIILDGVFSHTGDDSVYFNKYGRYSGGGAYQSSDSPYYSWYKFDEHPDRYSSWWGFESLPEVNERDPSWMNYMIGGQDSVVRHWLREGAAGYRLDVADELPDETIEHIRAALKETDPEAFLLGEVWEDATTKQSYGTQRTYALGRGLDSVMNYPFLNRTVEFLMGKIDVWLYCRFLTHQRHTYPAPMYYSLMNLVSSHDVCRIRSALSGDCDMEAMTRPEQAVFELSPAEYELGSRRQRLAAAIQFSLPGIPSVYYGDEAGMTGLLDPFNRKPFREEDAGLVSWYRTLGALRSEHPVLCTGAVSFFSTNGNVLGILRYTVDGRDYFGKNIGLSAILTLVNPTDEKHRIVLDLEEVWDTAAYDDSNGNGLSGIQTIQSLLTERKAAFEKGLVEIDMPPLEAGIFKVL